MQDKNASRPVWPFVLMAAGVLLVLSAVGAYFALSGNEAAAPTPTQAVSSIDPSSIERVSAADAYTAFSKHQAVIVDVRSVENYNASHAKGAISIPLQDLPDRISELNPEDWIIPY